MEIAVLEALRLYEGEWVAEDVLTRRLDMAAEMLRAEVAALRTEGYEIEYSPSVGYKFDGFGDRLIPREIQRGLNTRIMGSRVVCLDSTASTNDIAWQEALAGASEGTVILAEEQTAGRGRMGRVWESPPRAGLLMSLILRPEVDPQDAHLITIVGAVAVAEALRERARLDARIRWPNDITIKDRKVAGILVEGRRLATGAVFVLGIGLNVNTLSEDLPPSLREIATSLAIESGRSLVRADVMRWLMMALERWYRDFRFGDYGRIARLWRRRSSTLGRRVLLVESGREFKGTVLDLSLEEGLIVRLDNGVTRIFHPSTVTLRQLS